MNKTSKILIVLLVVFILGGAGTSYYFYSKYNDTKKELDLLKKENETIEQEKEEVSTGNVLIDGEVITEDSSEGETVLFDMNGKQHRLSFKYSYVSSPSGYNPEDTAYYYSYKVKVDVFLDEINITELSESIKDLYVYVEIKDKTEEEVRNYLSTISLMEEYDLQVIKGLDNKEYLFINLLEHREDNGKDSKSLVINSEGKVVYEILDKINFTVGFILIDPAEQVLFGYKGYHIVMNNNNQHEIIALTYKKKESGGDEYIGYHDAFKSTITISNDEPNVNETPLDIVLYEPYMEW